MHAVSSLSVAVHSNRRNFVLQLVFGTVLALALLVMTLIVVYVTIPVLMMASSDPPKPEGWSHSKTLWMEHKVLPYECLRAANNLQLQFSSAPLDVRVELGKDGFVLGVPGLEEPIEGRFGYSHSDEHTLLLQVAAPGKRPPDEIFDRLRAALDELSDRVMVACELTRQRKVN